MRHALRRTLWLGASSTLLASACSDSTAVGDTAGAATVRGSVTSAKTSAGIGNLIVALVRDTRVVDASVTDSAGRFQFPATPPGDYVLRLTGAELAGISPRFTAFEPPQLSVHVGGGEPGDLFFAAVGLVPPRVVGVVTCAGVPVQGAVVRVIGGETDAQAVTNAQGRYAVTDLEPGHYAILVDVAPCDVSPRYGVAALLAGQAAQVDFGG